jgi:predicted membrane-bound mannosyltransferase
VSVVLFSSFFTNWHGVWDSVWTYFTWSKRAAGATLHNHPWYFYFKLLLCFKEEGGPFWTEGLIVLLALAGCVAAIRSTTVLGCVHGPDARGATNGGAEPQKAFAAFLALYTLVLTAIYSFISYKTPWCMLTFLHGMILLAGLGAVAIIRSLPHLALKTLACVLLAAGLCHLGWQACRASFNSKYFADWHNPYVYAHTSPDICHLAEDIEELARIHPQGHKMIIKVIAQDYWPLPWYLRRFSQVGYWHQLPDDGDVDAPVVISSVADEEAPGTVHEPELNDKLRQDMKWKYQNAGFRGLRPGVKLLLYVEQDLWKEFVNRRR